MNCQNSSARAGTPAHLRQRPRFRNSAWVQPALLSLLVLFSCSLTFAQQTAPGSPRPNEPHKQFDAGGSIHFPHSRSYAIQHYKLVLSFNFDKGEVAGTDTITLRPFGSSAGEIQLDSSGLTIDKVALASGAPLNFRTDEDHLYIAPDRTYAAADVISIDITYHGSPRKGLYFIRHDAAYPDKPDQIWSQGEPEDNHYWFPCYDFPNEKATSEVIVAVPAGWTLISNGKLIETKDLSGGARSFHWYESIPHSSYLTSIIAGRFTEVEQRALDKPLTYYVPPGVDRDTTLRSFGGTPDMINTFSRLLGVPYAYEKYAQSAAVDYIFGGMENISATTQTAVTLHDEIAERDHFSSQGLVAHELAHQWFGDLLTTEDWANIWLNEGFATFMDAQYTFAHDGEEEYRYQILVNAETYQGEDRDNYRRPIVERRYSDVQHMFDRTTYQKGSVVLDMLAWVLGRDGLLRGLHQYLETFRARNVTTHDLEETLSQVSGQNLEWFFDEWLYHAGYPEYRVNASWDPVAKLEHIRVEQTQTVTDETPFFRMPVDVSITTAGGTRAYRVLSEGQQQDFYFPAESAPLMTLFDSGNRILKTLDFKKSETELIFQVEHDPSLVGRIWAIRQLAGGAESSGVAALSRSLKADDFWAVRLEAANALGQVRSNQALEALLGAPVDKDTRVQAAVVQALGKFPKDQRAVEAVMTALKDDQSYRVPASAARALGELKPAVAFDTLESTLNRQSYRNVIATSAITAMARLGDKRAVPIAIKAAQPGKPVEVRQAALSLLAQLGKGDDSAYQALTEAAADSNVLIRAVAYDSLGELGDRRALPLLQVAANREVLSRAHDAALGAMDTLRRQASNAPSVQQELEQLRQTNAQLEHRITVLEQKHP